VQRSRHPGERDRRYLTALIGWGYKPSDVEQLVLADTTTTGDTDADSDEDGPLEDTASDADVDTEVGYVDVEAGDV